MPLLAARTAVPRYVILMIGDGMGLPHIQLAEAFLGAQAGVLRAPLRMSSLPVTGLACTHSANSYVTDSAAGGTALACGRKTNNGMLGINCSTTLQFASIATLARCHGKKVGMVTTDTLVGATPAAFFAHQVDRGTGYPVGVDLLTSSFDFFFATGDFVDPDGSNIPVCALADLTNSLAGFILPDATGTNPAAVLWQPLPPLTARYGYAWIDSTRALRAVQPPIQKTIAVVDVPRALVAASNALTLAEVTRKSLALLDNTNGFFLMVEGAHIDKLAHLNDGAAVVHEVLAFDCAVAAAYEFYTNHPDETLLVITADHETGGITLGHGDNRFGLLARQRVLGTDFSAMLDAYRATHTTRGALARWLATILHTRNAGKQPAAFADIMPLLHQCFGFGCRAGDVHLATNEWRLLAQAFQDSLCDKELYPDDAALRTHYGGQDPLTITALRLLNEKAGLRWASFDHTGTAVPVFACGVGSTAFCGMQDNTTIPQKIMRLMLPEVAFPVAAPRAE
jgi:alkaline phosphatase